jgi:hypothetical protein
VSVQPQVERAGGPRFGGQMVQESIDERAAAVRRGDEQAPSETASAVR